MSVCTFFGHHDCPAEVKPKLREILSERLLRQSDYVVAYVTHFRGGAAQFAEMAERQEKTVIRL